MTYFNDNEDRQNEIAEDIEREKIMCEEIEQEAAEKVKRIRSMSEEEAKAEIDRLIKSIANLDY